MGKRPPSPRSGAEAPSDKCVEQPWDKRAREMADGPMSSRHPDAMHVVIPPAIARQVRAWAEYHDIDATDLAALAIILAVQGGGLVGWLGGMRYLGQARAIAAAQAHPDGDAYRDGVRCYACGRVAPVESEEGGGDVG